MENHTRLRTTLFEDAFRNLFSHNKAILEALDRQLFPALAIWALVKMGKKRNRYMELAIKNFLTMAAGMIALKQWDTSRAIKGVSLIIPTTLTEKRTSPFDRLRSDVEPDGSRTLCDLLSRLTLPQYT